MNAGNALQKLQGLPENARKGIAWGVTGLVGISLLFWWISGVQKSFQGASQSNVAEQLQLETLEQELQNIPIHGDKQ